jgi:site-specific DNA-adenine methylase
MNCKKKFRALFQYRGSKDDVAHRIWERFGVDVNVYCEPFGGRFGCLLQRDVTGEISRNSVEVVGDINAKIVNVFRAIKHAPKELAAHLSNEVLAEIDVLARDKWLRDHRQKLESLLLSHPESYWLEAAAWTIYQISLLPDTGVSRSARKKVMLSFSADIYAYDDKLGYLLALAERLKNVRLVYGDWERTVRACPGGKVTAVFFDPPYGWDSGRRMAMYDHDEPHVAKEVFLLQNSVCQRPTLWWRGQLSPLPHFRSHATRPNSQTADARYRDRRRGSVWPVEIFR